MTGYLRLVGWIVIFLPISGNELSQFIPLLLKGHAQALLGHFLLRQGVEISCVIPGVVHQS